VLSLFFATVTGDAIPSPDAGPTYSIVLTIVHTNGTSILSLHIGDLGRERFWLLKAMNRATTQGRTVGIMDTKQVYGRRIGRRQRWAVPTYSKNHEVR
jgi:hypothetical protein